MLKTHFQIAFRHLLKHKFYAFINIFGLAVGITACLLLFRLVHYELSFDTFQPNYDRIARVITIEKDQSGESSKTPGSPLPAQDVMQNSISQFEYFARVHGAYGAQFTAESGTAAEKKLIIEEGSIYTEPAFFDVFAWKWLSGDPKTALKAPNAVVLSSKTAEKFFGNWQQAQGKNLLLDNKTQLSVVGVVEDAPVNSDFQIQVFISYETYKNQKGPFGYQSDWGGISSNDHAYVLLRDPSQFDAANAQIATVGQKEYGGQTSDKKHQLQALSDMHFNTEIGTLGSHVVGKSRLLTLSLIGLLILVMACFNFINLATALAVNRSKEVGVRKSLGGQKSQLMAQFMSETSVIVLLAAGIGTGLAALLAPQLKKISDVPDELPFLSNPTVWAFLGITSLVVSLLSGLYPALVLTRFDPIQALKNKLSSSSIAGFSLRKVLVLAQFAIAQGLIISTLIALSQMHYIRNMELGFSPNLVYNVGMASDSVYLSKFETFKGRLLQIPGVESVSFSSDVPSSQNNWDNNFALGQGAEDAPFSTSLKFADEDYFKTYGLKIVAGRALSPSDTIKEVVVNETLIKRLGYQNAQEVIGKELRIGRRRWVPVVGVVADFKTASARDNINPISIFSRKMYYGNAGIKIRPENMDATTQKIKTLWEETFPDQVFDGEYYDESIADFYKDENRFSAFCKSFALLAILISCLGLLGLASLMAAQKTKEIGIRKVLGASVSSITGLLAKDFILLVGVAILISSPVAWYLMQKWLEDFVFRIDISWWIFVSAGMISLAVAFLTVSFQSIRAALANPVESLRNE